MKKETNKSLRSLKLPELYDIILIYDSVLILADVSIL
jgi:hypothetical protein